MAERITPFYEAALECTLQCDAEAVLWGANYDQDLTWPSFFSDQITPWLQHASERLHSAGKVMFTHCDGENDALTELLLESGADVAESICPAPMTKLGLAKLRGRWGTTVAICGGIPSVALLPDVFDDDAYRQFMDATFAELGSGSSLILGVADMVLAEADLGRLEDIGRRIEAFGPVG